MTTQPTLAQPAFRPEWSSDVICQNFRLDEWLKKSPGGPSKYFRVIDELREVFRRRIEIEPQDGDIVLTLAAALRSDLTLRRYVLSRTGSSDLTSEEKQNDVRIAAAGMMMVRYNDARARGDWPPVGASA